jgi:hypothetical protein
MVCNNTAYLQTFWEISQMPARLPLHWRERVRTQRKNHPSYGPARIRAALAEQWEDTGEDPLPSERWIANAVADFDRLSEEEQTRYQALHWPETFVNGGLPWECAPIAMRIAAHLPVGQRPLVGHLLWAWRIAQIKPDASVDEWWQASRTMALWELEPPRNAQPAEVIEQWLLGRGDLVGLSFDFSEDSEESERRAAWSGVLRPPRTGREER